MKAALVELWINPKGMEPAPRVSYSETLTSVLRSNPSQREAQARAACDVAKARGASMIVFPGWTVVATDPPQWILDASHGRIIVFECLFPASQGAKTRAASEEWPTWRTFIAHDGIVRVLATQQFATAYDREAYGSNLVQEFSSERRTFDRATLWICGEVELLSGGGGRRGGGSNVVRNDWGVADDVLRGGGIVDQSAHASRTPALSHDDHFR